MLENCMCRINCDLVICLISVFHTKVVVVKRDVKVWQNQPLFNELPDDSGHFVTVEFDNGVSNFDLGHDVAFRALVWYLYTIAQTVSACPTICSNGL